MPMSVSTNNQKDIAVRTNQERKIYLHEERVFYVAVISYQRRARH